MLLLRRHDAIIARPVGEKPVRYPPWAESSGGETFTPKPEDGARSG